MITFLCILSSLRLLFQIVVIKIMNTVRNKLSTWLFLILKKTMRFLPDRPYIKIMFFIWRWKRLDLNNPKTFCEKLQWLKLYDRRPEYTQMVDKYEVKKYVAGVIGEEYIIPTIGVWDSVSKIDWDILPKQFVIKCTHDSGSVIICKDKSVFDKYDAIKKLEEWMKRDYYINGREWPYKNVPHRIIAEEYIQPDVVTNDLPDYKYFCFNGVPKLMFVATERHNENDETRFDFFDMDYNHLDIKNGHPFANIIPSKPKNFELMKELSKKLSKGIPHVRVDFYEVNGRVFFGELTFSHWSGLVPFEPEKWDDILGSWIVLPSKTE